MIYKTIKIVAVALTMLAGGSSWAADHTVMVTNTVNKTFKIDLLTSSGFTVNTSLNSGQTYTWKVPQDKGCLSTINIDGKEAWSGSACDENTTVVIYQGWGGSPYGIEVSP